MNHKDDITPIIQFHYGIAGFNYDLVVDWAIGLIEKGIESDNIYMLASFQKPVYSHEIRPYLSDVLKDLQLDEKVNNNTLQGYIYHYIKKILRGENLKENLHFLKELYIDEEFHQNRYLEHGITEFSNLYWAWIDVENDRYSWEYEGATKDNIKDLVRNEALDWENEYIHKPNALDPSENGADDFVSAKKRKTSFSEKLKKWFAK